MPISRQDKETQVAALTDRFSRQEAAVIAHYHGLTVRDLADLRAKLREQGVDFQVAKNTLLKLSAKESGIEAEFTGPTAVAFGYEDPVTTSKVVNDFAKENENLEIVGGIVENQLVDVATVKKLAALPSREELLGKFVGSISSPARNLASVLTATTRNLVYALKAVQEAK